jgi:hypothetical protein
MAGRNLVWWLALTGILLKIWLVLQRLPVVCTPLCLLPKMQRTTGKCACVHLSLRRAVGHVNVGTACLRLHAPGREGAGGG